MGTKQFDSATDLITFTRASGGTFLGSNGLIQTATNNTPRIEYNADGTVKGLLIEEARTNLYLNSNQFVSPWSLIGSTVTASAGTSPTGLADAWRWVGDGTSVLYQGTPYVAGDYTVSAWVKSNGAGEDTFRLYGLNTIISGDFTATSEWVRYSYTFTSAINGSQFSGLTYGTSQGNVDLLVYGLQIEAGAFPTSYIPTTGSTATRAADVATIPTANFGYNSNAGSVLVEAQRFGTNNYPRSVMIDAGSESNSIGLGAWGPNTSLTGYIVSGNVVQAAPGTGNVGSSAFKNSLAYKENNFAASRDGGTVVTDTSGVVPTGLTTLRLGRNGVDAQFLNGHIKSIQYYPRRLSNAQLQELTT